MPTLKSPQEIALEVDQKIRDGEILVGTSISSEELTDAIVDGELVKKELVVNVHSEDLEDLTLHELKELFPERVILKGAGSVRVVCLTREEAENLSKKKTFLGEKELTYTLFKKVTVKAQFSYLRDVITKILNDSLPSCTFVPGSHLSLSIILTQRKELLFLLGQVYNLKLLLWADAKYTYVEKSFIKVALMGAPFPKHRTKIYRWGDLFGHEVELLDPLLVAPILVTPSTLFSASCIHSFNFVVLTFRYRSKD